MPEPAAIVCTDDTTQMIEKYMMTSRLSESWPAGDANRRYPRAGGIEQYLAFVDGGHRERGRVGTSHF